MKTSDFNYDLPENLIAQTPLKERDYSRLMVLHKNSGNIEHKHFYDIINYISPGDCLILNDSRVLPARIYGIKEDTGAKVEFLLLNQKSNDVWEVLAGPGKRAKPGTKFTFGDGILEAEVLEITSSGNRIVKFAYQGNFYSILDKIGQMPLPHYITKQLNDKERYQTVYSKIEGSSAAPTAGLHFTKELMQKLIDKGVIIVNVLLHVGLGTFRPVSEDNILAHEMHSEYYEITQDSADVINQAIKENRRIFAVGTTSVRTLESSTQKVGDKYFVKAGKGDTNIFIYPGYQFKIVKGLITNFHLPESTLIMLVSAFCGLDETLNFYNVAVQEKYRFFSFGDACLLL